MRPPCAPPYRSKTMAMILTTAVVFGIISFGARGVAFIGSAALLSLGDWGRREALGQYVVVAGIVGGHVQVCAVVGKEGHYVMWGLLLVITEGVITYYLVRDMIHLGQF